MNSEQENIKRFGQLVTGHGSAWLKEREVISLSFNTQSGEVLRIQMKREEAKWLFCQLIRYHVMDLKAKSEKGAAQSAPEDSAKAEATQETQRSWIPPDLDWPDDGETNIPKSPDDQRAILRDMINIGLVDLTIGKKLLLFLEGYRRGVIKL